MTPLAGYGFSYDPGVSPEPAPTQLFAWQVCLAHPETSSLEDASNYADYAINRDRIVQMLGVGMPGGQNAFTLDGQMFAVAISMQVDGRIELVGPDHRLYGQVALVVAEQLLSGADHGMVAALPNGHLIPFEPPADPAEL